MPVSEVPVGENLRKTKVSKCPAPIPPDLEVAYGIISGIVFGLLVWVGLLLPALYFLF
jgi:hypothetical protein